MALATFDCLGFGAYFLYFKSSNSKWWEKILKFFVVLLLYAFMASATNFHYFDFPEFVAPILFFILWLVIINCKDNPIRSNITRIDNIEKEPLDILAESISEASINGSVVGSNSTETCHENQRSIGVHMPLKGEKMISQKLNRICSFVGIVVKKLRLILCTVNIVVVELMFQNQVKLVISFSR